MKKILRVLLILIVVVTIITTCAFVYFNSKFPADIPVENIKVELTPERIQRGMYLANNVSMCTDCHSERDWNYFSGPVKEETIGSGGEMFNEPIANVPGTIYSKNITPAGISDYSDGELLRVITTGIDKNGSALFPLMPYMHYRKMAREDIYSIIAYLRTLKPIANKIPERSLNFPMNFIVNTIPMTADLLDAIPSKGDTLEYGKYMANAAACIACHTQLDKGKFVPGMEFAGGFRFQFPNGDQVFTANITPDVETGIGALTKEGFIARFKSFAGQNSRIPVKEHEKNTVMPWTRLGGMTEEDLGAIYTYLRTVTPVKNKVVTFRPRAML
jgi:hypothetical protein